jgi:hyperosmotically inducible periplasmic protein
MNKRLLASPLSLLAVVALAGAVSACSTTEPASMQIDDATITTRVAARIVADPELNPFEIDVDTQNGVVRLSGTVDEAGDRQKAEEVARDTSGVRDVVNEIEVGDKTLGDTVDDTVIGTRIKAKLTADPQINPFNIDVDVERGVVTLSGRVPTEQDRRHAEELARQTSGVKEVRNRLEVGDLTKNR